MNAASVEAYFRTTRSAATAIYTALEAAEVEPTQVRSALDFGCGYGRVYRAFPVMFPNASLVASDLMDEAATFCASTFGGRAVQSNEAMTVDLGERFDVIWLGSVLTHLPRPAWDRLHALLAAHTHPGGVVIYTVHGARSLEQMEEGPLKRNPHLIEAAQWQRIKSSVGETGFEFVSQRPANHEAAINMGMNVTREEYGFCFTSRHWVCEYAAGLTDWTLVGYFDRLWGNNHDVVVLKRA